MLKALCLAGFLSGLIGALVSYTLDYFNINQDKIDETNNEILKKD